MVRWCGDTLPLFLDMSGTISLLFYLENINPQIPPRKVDLVYFRGAWKDSRMRLREIASKKSQRAFALKL